MYSTCNKPVAVHLVRRNKLLTPGAKHFGVAVEFETPRCISIFELGYSELREVSVRDFKRNQEMDILCTIKRPRLVDDAIRRLNCIINHADSLNYNPLFQNCEHFARQVVQGKKQSMQVQTVVTLVILTVVITLLSQDN